MNTPDLPVPEEPHALKHMARTLLDQAPDAGLPLVVAGDWIASPLWEGWGEALAARDMDRETFGRVVAGYGNEVRLWVVGERPWEHCVSGLAGRVERRLAPVAEAIASQSARSVAGRPGPRRRGAGRRDGQACLPHRRTAPPL